MANRIDPQAKSGYRTLLASVLLSSPGPLVLGLGLLVGRSSTQIADFTRRTAELLAIIVSFAVYAMTNRAGEDDPARTARLERNANRFTGVIMCVSGLSMILLTFTSGTGDKGNVIPALAIAFLGAVTNVFFWRRYTGLSRAEGNAVLDAQARLYGAKSVVDVCVTLTLLAVLAFPGSRISGILDTFGSVLVSLYMIRGGIRTLREAHRT